jgi:hypothetical protein
LASETTHKNCLNCNSELPQKAKYCSNCGQKFDSPLIRFKDFIKDAFEDYFSIDSKIFRSLIPLLFKPGFLTNEYIKGKRNSYIPPFRMFLIISVIYFLFLSISEEKDDFIKIIDDAETKDETINNKDTSETKTKNQDVSMSFNGLGDSKMALVIEKIKDSTEQAYINRHGLKAYVDSVFYNENPFFKFWSRKLFAMYLTDGKNFGELLFSMVQKIVFIMAPIMAFILFLLYRRKKVMYMQHLIFAFHFHAFVFLLLFLDELISYLGVSWLSGIVFLILLLYLLIALKKVYAQGFWKSFLKFILLFAGYILLGIPTLGILTVISAILLY